MNTSKDDKEYQEENRNNSVFYSQYAVHTIPTFICLRQLILMYVTLSHRYINICHK